MLTYDQIPPDRLPILDYTSRLGDDGHLGVLAVALAQWAARDETRADPHARIAANTAMDALDAMLAEGHQLRARLVAEIRASDDAAAERADQLLAVQPGDEDQADDDEPGDDETYACSACGGLISMFIGRHGWQHYTGQGTAASPVELYDAGHEATP